MSDTDEADELRVEAELSTRYPEMGQEEGLRPEGEVTTEPEPDRHPVIAQDQANVSDKNIDREKASIITNKELHALTDRLPLPIDTRAKIYQTTESIEATSPKPSSPPSPPTLPPIVQPIKQTPYKPSLPQFCCTAPAGRKRNSNDEDEVEDASSTSKRPCLHPERGR